MLGLLVSWFLLNLSAWISSWGRIFDGISAPSFDAPVGFIFISEP